MTKVILMCGIPGSGKSTLAKGLLLDGDVYVSRDEIRFVMVKEDEPYFLKEDQVFECFVNTVKANIISKKERIYVDATHLNAKSRAKVMRELRHFEDVGFEAIFVDTPLEVAIERNEKRAGTRAHVPQDVIRNMNRTLTCPEYNEGFEKIWIKEVDIPIYLKERENDE